MTKNKSVSDIAKEIFEKKPRPTSLTIVLGCPGSGKTCLTQEILSKYLEIGGREAIVSCLKNEYPQSADATATDAQERICVVDPVYRDNVLKPDFNEYILVGQSVHDLPRLQNLSVFNDDTRVTVIGFKTREEHTATFLGRVIKRDESDFFEMVQGDFHIGTVDFQTLAAELRRLRLV